MRYVTPLAVCLAPVALADDFVRPIEEAHNTAAYYEREAVKAAFDVDFGGGDLIAGTVWFDTPVGKARIETTDGATIVFDGTSCWVSPADAEVPGPPARFHILTWPYFIAAMHKLDDPGTNLSEAGELPMMGGDAQPAAKLTFDAGVGDAPDDWYLIFRERATQRLAALAYIVTFGKPAEEAEKQPSLVTYGGWEEVDGVTFATQYTFYFWNPEAGVQGDPKGRMTVGDVEFVTPGELFVRPADAREDLLPG